MAAPPHNAKKRTAKHLTEPIKKKRKPNEKTEPVENKEMKENKDQKKERKAYLMTFDTEVNGWRKFDENGKRLSVDPESRVVELGWSLFDIHSNLIETKSEYIQPVDFKVNEEQMASYGITQKLLKEKGIPMKSVLKTFVSDLKIIVDNNGYVGCHKYEYDSTLIIAEDSRIEPKAFGIEELLQRIRDHIVDTHSLDLLKRLNKKDKSICDSNHQLKWYPNKKWGPSLSALYSFLCDGDKNDKAHEAGIDAEMCGDVIFALKTKYKIGLLK